MGDHARRKMIVRDTQVFRQNPAYRPTTSPIASGDLVRGYCFSLSVVSTLVCCLVSCARIPSGNPPGPRPDAAGAITPSAGPWIFNYAPGTATYQISRIAAIEAQTDSGIRREVSSNTTRESLTFEQVDSQIKVTAFVDTFAITTQGSIGPVQTVQLPVYLRAIFTGDSVSSAPEQKGEKCNPVSSAVERDLRNLLITFPKLLSPGMQWRDSTSNSGCQGAIQTISRTTRSYLVVGEATYDGLKGLLIQRSDTLSAHGSGAQQQHQLTLDGSGTGKASYYLNTQSGQVLRLTTQQDLSLSITTSGRVHHFRENSTQDFRLVR